MSKGFIKLNRDILDSYVFAHPTALKIWLWLLLKARWKDGFSSIDTGNRAAIVELKRGQLIFGRFKAEQSIDIDGSTIYKWIQKFQENQLIKIESNNRFSIITICDYDIYDEETNQEEQQGSSEVTAKEQQSSSNVTHKKKDKKVNKVKKVEEGEGEKFIPPSFQEVWEYFIQNGYTEYAAKKAFDYYESAKWIDSRGNKVRNWKQKMISVWFKPENKQEERGFVC